MKQPLITLGISCFNAEDTIERALRTAQGQDWPNFEIIVVDDASSDNSVEIIQSIAEKDRRIILIRHQKNTGLSGAVNTITNNANGDYIALFDDDDEYDCKRVSLQYERLSTFEKKINPHPVLCYTNKLIKTNGKLEKRTSIGSKGPEPHGLPVVDFLLWLKMDKRFNWGLISTGTMMAARKVLLKYPLDTDLRRTEDWDLAIRVAMDGGYFISTEEYLTLQYVTESSDKSGNIPLENHLRLVRKHKEYLTRERTYWGAMLFAYARFYRTRNILKCILFMGVACLLSSKVLASTIEIAVRGFNKSRMS